MVICQYPFFFPATINGQPQLFIRWVILPSLLPPIQPRGCFNSTTTRRRHVTRVYNVVLCTISVRWLPLSSWVDNSWYLEIYWFVPAKTSPMYEWNLQECTPNVASSDMTGNSCVIHKKMACFRRVVFENRLISQVLRHQISWFLYWHKVHGKPR